MKKKLRRFCWNSILSVPRTFWGVFIKNVLVFQLSLVFQAKFIELPAEIFQQSSKMHFEPKLFDLWRIFWTESSKMHFTCPEEHFDENIVGFSKQISILGEKTADWRRKIRSVGIKSALLSPDGQLEKKFWKNFYFFWLFPDVQGAFFGFFLVSI